MVHLHTNETIVIATIEDGLLPISQHSMFSINQMAYHAYEGLAVNSEEKDRLQEDLGSANILMLPNHGALALGRSVGEAFMRWRTYKKLVKFK